MINQSIFNQTNYLGAEECFNTVAFEFYQSSFVNFTPHNFSEFNPNRKKIPTHELIIKILLCSISIIASLAGNLIVIYSILVKSSSSNNNFYNFDYKTRSSLNLNRKITSTTYLNRKKSSLINLSIKSRNIQTRNIDFDNISIYNNHLKIKSSNRLAQHNNLNEILPENEENVVEKKLIVTRIYRPYKNKSVNLFILNLCICDLMIVVWCSWVHMINSISQNWIMGSFFCKFNTYVQGRK